MGTGDGMAQSSSRSWLPPASMTGSGPGIARVVGTRSIGKLANKCRVSRHLLNLFIRGFPLVHSAGRASAGMARSSEVDGRLLEVLLPDRLGLCGSCGSDISETTL